MTGFDNFATAAQASTLPLVETITTFVRARIDDRALRAGMRMPSIRQFAADHGVSRFTVVEAYDRLVAQGHLESRRGSGFYVRERAQPATARPAPASTAVDIVWLLRQMYADHSGQDILLAGSGYLPSAWLDEEMIAAAMRSVARRDGGRFTAYGTAQGYAPLRELLQLHLEELEINAHADQIVLTAGASQALDLVVRHFLQPGDTVLVDEPGYYVLFGRLAATGVRLLGVPRTVDGVDVDRLEELVKAHKPRLYFLQSVLHNPTGTSLSAATAFRILRLAETHDFYICEDDVYSDLHPGRAHRVAALDQLKRVLYVGSFSKSLGAGLRVGYVAASNELAQRLSDHKMLASLTTPELNERLVHQILSEGQYRKHAERLRARLRRATEPAVRNLEKAGLKLFHEPKAGMFVWARADETMDAEKIAATAQTQNILIAPGSLFSTTQARSAWMRFHVAHAGNPKLLRFFDSLT